jgi:hypothetical protein
MTVLATIRREERKLERQLSNLQHQLDGVRTAAKVLGKSKGREVNIFSRLVEPYRGSHPLAMQSFLGGEPLRLTIYGRRELVAVGTRSDS